MYWKLIKECRFSGKNIKPDSFSASIVFCTCILTANLLFAQADRSGLSGAVADSSGRLLPQTHITVVQNSTHLKRETVSNSSGAYSISGLPVGVYTVTFEHPGFKPLTYDEVVQLIGRTRTLDAFLQVAGSEERINISASSALIDRNTSAATGLIEKEQADELPLNGRNWSMLTTFVPGAIDTGGGNQRSVRFAGRGLDDSNFTFDGVDATNVVNQTQRPWVRLAIPLDAIQEFRVDSLMATAEEGGTGGAQLAVSSSPGTNRFHGRLFEFLRNDLLDAPLPEWGTPQVWTSNQGQQPEQKQALRLNQFGGSLGGPIVRDKTFFFLASEAYRQVWGYPVSGDVPSQTLIDSVSSSSPVYAIVNGYPGVGPKTTLVTNCSFCTSDISLLASEGAQVVNENSVMLRLDQSFSTKTTGFMRFSYDRSVNTQPPSVSATDLQQRVSSPVSGVLELMHVFNPNLVNETKAGFNRATSNTYYHSDSGIIYKISISGGPGPGFVPEYYDYASIYAGNSFSGIDNLTWVHDRHTVKAGVEIRHIQLNQEYGESGTLSFSTIENLVNNIVKQASLTGAMPVNNLRKNDYYLYAQDEFKALSNLTLNLGVRYSVFGLFDEKNGLANPFDFDTCGTQGFCGVGSSFGQQNYGDIDPRVAFAWTPQQNGRTVIRGGFGVYHEDGQLDDQNLPAKNEVPSYVVKNISLPSGFPATSITYSAGSLSPNAEQRNRKDSYVEQWSFSVQRELPASFVATLSYLGSHGVHLLETNEVNLINPNTGEAQYYSSGFSSPIKWRGSVGMSSYNGFSVAMRRPFTNGLLVTANYTWSHEIDNGSNGSGDGDNMYPQDAACQACDRASGDWDARHVFNGNAVYQLPFGPGKLMLNKRGVASAIASNWDLTTTAMARTGFPVNVVTVLYGPDGNTAGTQRPNLVPGVSLTPPGGSTVTEWFNPAAFQIPALNAHGNASTFGSAPRNPVRGPGTWQIDLGAGKTIPMTERAKLEFRAEFYNVFNHPQLGQPAATCSGNGSTSGPTACASGLGQISSTINLNTSIVNPITPVGSGTPREIQFALRMDF